MKLSRPNLQLSSGHPLIYHDGFYYYMNTTVHNLTIRKTTTYSRARQPKERRCTESVFYALLRGMR